jgi:Tol biopolymer transport system component
MIQKALKKQTASVVTITIILMLLSTSCRKIYYMNEISEDVYLYDIEQDSLTRLTFSPEDLKHGLAVSPTGNKFAYCTANEVYEIDLSNATNQLIVQGEFIHGISYSPDGNQLAYVDGNKLFTINIDGSNKTQLLTVDYFSEIQWAPNGEFIVCSNDLGLSVVTLNGELTVLADHPDNWDISVNSEKIYFSANSYNYESQIYCYYLNTNEVFQITEFDGYYGYLKCNPVKDEVIVTVSHDYGVVDLYLIDSTANEPQFLFHKEHIAAPEYASSGEKIVYFGNYPEMVISDFSGNDEIIDFGNFADRYTMKWSNDDKYLILIVSDDWVNPTPKKNMFNS